MGTFIGTKRIVDSGGSKIVSPMLRHGFKAMSYKVSSAMGWSQDRDLELYLNCDRERVTTSESIRLEMTGFEVSLATP